VRIKFLQPFGGHEIDGEFYEAGQIIDEKQGADRFVTLAKCGIIEILPGEKPKPQSVSSIDIPVGVSSKPKSKQKAGK